jgi:riboflavin kinase/FMN adenylyltransferase
MQHYRSLQEVSLQGVWLTIGTFDGVHQGHQAITHQLVTGARQAGAVSVALTFFPPPALILKKRSEPYYLTTPEERARLLGELGVDVVITHPFTKELAAVSAHDFMALLKERLGLRHLCVGYDFALGRNREGDTTMLKQLGEKFGYAVETVSAVEVDGQVVSSSQIRAYLAAGEVEKAALLLGRPYQVVGEVVEGDGRGKLLGIPTANLSVWAERTIPRPGVYVCQAQVNGRVWGAVTNVGVRPTFENQPPLPRVETHLFDFSKDIYGQEIHLDFLAYLRDEARFPNPQALVEQIHQDMHQARNYLDSSRDG